MKNQDGNTVKLQFSFNLQCLMIFNMLEEAFMHLIWIECGRGSCPKLLSKLSGLGQLDCLIPHTRERCINALYGRVLKPWGTKDHWVLVNSAFIISVFNITCRHNCTLFFFPPLSQSCKLSCEVNLGKESLMAMVEYIYMVLRMGTKGMVSKNI